MAAIRTVLATMLVCLAVPSNAHAVHSLPSGFDDPAVFSGLTFPMAVRFSPDGRVVVAEKSGIIKVYNGLADATPDAFADLSTNVHDFWDRGLLGLALHPNFPSTPYVYVLYTYDYDPNTPTLPAPRWGDECPGSPTGPGATVDGCVVNGRLSRLEINASNQLVGGETVLLENNWCQQYPSHSLGSLNFGPEGALYLQAGDGASFNYEDYGQSGGTIGTFTPKNPCGDPPSGRGGNQTPPTAEGGALRSQDLRTSGDSNVTFDGTVLRIDPATGAAWPDNPLVGGANANDDRIIAYGLRNPFRATIRPGTSELWLGDVGWNNWEEINRLVDPLGAVENFGWPCYEGSGRQAGYDNTNLNVCENLYAAGANAVVAPYYTYNHGSDVDPLGDGCRTGGSSAAGLAFYTSGTYPATYSDALFFADYSRDCIYVMRTGANGLPDLGTRTAFVVDAFNPVDLQRGPGGDLFYADYDGGKIRRIGYTTGNAAPAALAQAVPTTGPLPLTVQFDGSGSTDPDAGSTLFYAWDLDADGQYDDASIVDPSWTYTSAGTVNVGLQVTDDDGASDIDVITIVAGLAPPTATVLAPAPTSPWRVGDPISYSGEGTDAEDGPLPPSAMHWDIVLNHCPGGPGDCHAHVVEHHDGVAGGVYTAPDHEWYSYLEFRLTVDDTDGLHGTDVVAVDPVSVTNSFASEPPGMRIVLGGVERVAPFDESAIVSSTNSLSAVSPQILGPTQYYWASWSDGGAQSHAFVAGETGSSRTATFAECQALDVCDGRDNDCDGVADDPPPPGEIASLAVTRSMHSWTGRADATGYDVVRGGLGTLTNSAGDFGVAVDACVANGLAATSVPDTVDPPPGDGYWFVVRAVNCAGVGSYDSGSAWQAGSRDAEIQTSPSNCPSGDTEAPTPPGGLSLGTLPGLVTLAWNDAGDNVGVTLYGVHRSTTSGFVPSPANRIGLTGATFYRDVGFAGGTYYYVVTAQDAAGNVSGPSNEQGATVAADTTPPSVTIIVPAAGASVTGTITVTAGAVDDVGVIGALFLLDGEPLGPEDTLAPFTATWDTSTVASGVHALSARARDARGNLGFAPAVSVFTGLPPGLVGAWSFNEGSGLVAGDGSGNGNSGSIDGATWTSSGKFGNALSFDGINDWVAIADAGSLDLTTGMTLEAWVFPTAPLVSWVAVVDKDIDRYYLMASSQPSSTPAIGGTWVSGNHNTWAPGPLVPSVWTHLAATFDGTTARLFVNGTEVASRSETTPITTSNDPVHIGGDFYGEWFPGRIDEVRIYNRALSEAEIQTDMVAPLP